MLCLFGMINFINLFYYSAYFATIHGPRCIFWILFMGLTALFKLTFTFIYSSFNKISESQPNLLYDQVASLKSESTILSLKKPLKVERGCPRSQVGSIKVKIKKSSDDTTTPLEHPHWWSHNFSYLAPPKVTLFILPSYFTKHPTLVV